MQQDTAGMEKFQSITPSLCRGAQGVILAYDITDATSFYALSGWLSEIDCHIPSSVPKPIVGNELDQEHSRRVSTSEGQMFASYSRALFREGGTKTSLSVMQVFEDLVKNILNTEARNKSINASSRCQAVGKGAPQTNVAGGVNTVVGRYMINFSWGDLGEELNHDGLA
ncbi:ras family-domain-containing protein [Pisolithus microcarpus]|nr:ras family-domain-containing protein [Pisolithus microcarpus]